MIRALYSILFLTLLASTQVVAQDTIVTQDTLETRSPRKAVFLSAVLPGAGQIYNHKAEKGKRSFWKAPIVWAGIGTCTYFIIENNRFYKEFRSEYLHQLDPTTHPEGASADFYQSEGLDRYSTDNLRTALDQRRNWRDLSVVCLAGVYVLQLVDASVDAHLFNHNISPDLSLNIQPQVGIGFGTANYMGVKLTLFSRKK